jgi:uncharacterized protein (TIGR02217 family)
MSFLDKQFPCSISEGSTAGPERKTEIVTLGSGFEERNARWADSRRVYNAGYGMKSLNDLHEVVAFFEETRGMLYGFRWKDFVDFKSCPPENGITAFDQSIGVGDGTINTFQIRKKYGTGSTPWYRKITHPVVGTVRASVNGALKTEGTHYAVSHNTGVLTFLVGHIPTNGQIITVGFEFDVPARFDTDRLEINVSSFKFGTVPSIPIVELRV